MKTLIQDTPVRINTAIQDTRGTRIVLPAGTEVHSIRVSPNMENVWLEWKEAGRIERGKIDMIVPFAMSYDWSNIIHDTDAQPALP